MDPALSQLPMAISPRAADDQVLVLPGAYLPVLLPLACLPPEVRAQALAAIPGSPVGARVDADLARGRLDDAWALVRAVRTPIDASPGLARVLSLWQAQELARLQLGAPDGPILAVGVPPSDQELATNALADVRSLLDPWPWPRWSGPVLLVGASATVDGLGANESMLARPALPMLRLGTRPARADVAASWMRLALALSAPPPAGWPRWLEHGLVQYARARANYALVSPEAMAAARARAGAAAIAAELADGGAGDGDGQLDLALAQLLLHPRHRAHLDSALDLLRSGAGSVEALRIAYGWGAEDLARER